LRAKEEGHSVFYVVLLLVPIVTSIFGLVDFDVVVQHKKLTEQQHPNLIAIFHAYKTVHVMF
jgi:hypothetical protein